MRQRCTDMCQMHSRWLAVHLISPDAFAMTCGKSDARRTRIEKHTMCYHITGDRHRIDSIQRVLASSSNPSAKCCPLVLTMMGLFDLQWNDIDALDDIVNDRYMWGVGGYCPQWLRTLLNDSDSAVWNVTKHSPVAISVMQQKHALSIDLLYRENNDIREPTEVCFFVCN